MHYCYNGGTCYRLDTLSKHICQCLPWFAGKQCEFQRPVDETCDFKIFFTLNGLKIEAKLNCHVFDIYYEEINIARSIFGWINKTHVP